MAYLNNQNRIEDLENLISNKQSEILKAQTDVDNFEYVMSEDDYDEVLDAEGMVIVAGMAYYPSTILKNCDLTAYRCSKADYESSVDLDDVPEYQELVQNLENLEGDLVELESELEDLMDG
jgi:hypothetical protein